MASSTIPQVLVLGYARAGSSILKALGRRSTQFTTSLLVRPDSLSAKADELAPFRALGIKLVPGDLKASEAELVTLVQGYHIVISCVNHPLMGTDEMSLVRACHAAGVKRYLPTAFGVDEEAVGRNSPMSPIFDQKIDNYKQMKNIGLDITIVSCGLWTEWLFGGGGGDLLGLDWKNHLMTVIDGFDARVSTTSLLDLGELVAEVLLDTSTVNSHVHIQSSLVTLEDIAIALEKATGESWQRKVLTMKEAEELQAAAGPYSWLYTFRLIIARGCGVSWPVEESWNHQERKLPFKLHTLQEVANLVAETKVADK